LSDPKLEIYQGSTKIGENDNWASTLSTAFSSIGAFGLTAGSKRLAAPVETGLRSGRESLGKMEEAGT
jgi:hypothetical protein